MTEGFRSHSRFVSHLSEKLDKDFVLVDVGASGGIDPAWASFGAKLRAFGFEPNIVECDRLNLIENVGRVQYIPAFVAAPDDTVGVVERGDKFYFGNNPWNRLAVCKTMALKREMGDVSNLELTQRNDWEMTRLADVSKPVFLPRFFEDNQIEEVSFLKIDIDGPDFEVLQSIDGLYRKMGILGVAMEVNFVGGTNDYEHTFHNTDRFMRKHGYQLMSLTVRKYALAALPSPYLLPFAAQSKDGRPLQGDAIYALDLFSESNSDRILSIDKLMKLASIFSLVRSPDAAAELIRKYKSVLGSYFDINFALNLLAEEAQEHIVQPLDYSDYMKKFDDNDPMFYP